MVTRPGRVGSFSELGLREPSPRFGTHQPLDSGRVARAIADVEAMRRAVPLGKGVDSATWADLGRLSWLWQIVGDLEVASDAEWTNAAGARISATAASYRGWKGARTTGPAAEASVLEVVPPDEIAAIAAQRAAVRTFFDSLYRTTLP